MEAGANGLSTAHAHQPAEEGNRKEHVSVTTHVLNMAAWLACLQAARLREVKTKVKQDHVTVCPVQVRASL